MIDLHKSLDIILEEGPPDGGWHPLHSAMDLARQLQDAQQAVIDLQHQLGNIKTRMAGDLALALRRAKPGLNIAVDKQGCRIGYKTKVLHFTPDVEQGLWKVTSPNHRFLREFLKAHRRATLMSENLSELIEAIVAYFTAYYRTLGEEVEGTGILMIEEKRATLLDLASWRPVEQIKLRSRSSRPASQGAV